jgi:Transposase IS116/IS110/IS902 family
MLAANVEPWRMCVSVANVSLDRRPPARTTVAPYLIDPGVSTTGCGRRGSWPACHGRDRRVVLPDDMTVRQWVAHAGLDPCAFQSGTSVDKPARISKVGNAHIRRALFMPALVAVRHEPHVKAFFDKLVARGKKPIQAYIAVMRKLLHAIYGMFATETTFIGDKFHAAA